MAKLYIVLSLFYRKVMQGLFSVLETELHSYIHFADRLDNLYVHLLLLRVWYSNDR